MKHKLFTNENQYLNWARKVKVESCGGPDYRDEKLNEELVSQCKPIMYPCIAVYSFEDDFDRVGENSLRILEYVYEKEFSGFDPNKEQKKEKKNRANLDKYFIAVEDYLDAKEDGESEEILAKLSAKVDELAKKYDGPLAEFRAKCAYNKNPLKAYIGWNK